MRVPAKLLAAGAALAMVTAPIAASAQSVRFGSDASVRVGPTYSGQHYRHGPRVDPRHGYRYGYPRYGYRYDDRRSSTGAAVAAGIAGLAVGTMVGAAASGSGTTTTYYRGSPQPWTSEWYAYCSSKYRSFDPSSGTFLGYDGQRHFCR